MVYETSVGFIVIKRKPGIRILLMRRSDNGVWDFPKGHQLKENERNEDVAKRELYEETKIGNIKVIPGFKEEYTFINPKGSHRKIVLFLGETDQNPEISEEHSEYKWCSFEEANELVEFEEKKRTLAKVKEFLSLNHPLR